MPPPVDQPGLNLRIGWTHTLATALARGLARGLFSLDVHGREHLPRQEACLLCANHSSHVDTFALATATGEIRRRLVFLAAHDYFYQAPWRSGLVQRLICLVPFDRGRNISAARHNLHVLAGCRDAGRIIVLFPEGTRSPNGQIGTFKSGAALFADKLGLPVVPCGIEGAYAALPKGRRLPRPHPLRVAFGVPLRMTPGRAGESGAERAARYEAFTTLLRDRVVVLQSGETGSEVVPA